MNNCEQMKLFECNIKASKRIRTKPIWKKFYSVYAYDYTKYHDICDAVQNKNYIELFNKYPELDKKLIASFSRFDEEKIRKLCFFLDDDKNKKHNVDEKHIYRLKTLHKIYEELYFYAELPIYATEDYITNIKSKKDILLADASLLFQLEKLENNGFKVHFDSEFGNTLEIQGTELMSIKERLKVHIKLLRRLRNKQPLICH